MYIFFPAKKKYWLTAFACLLSLFCQAQWPVPVFKSQRPARIAKMEIKDTSLLGVIKNFIMEAKATDTAFRNSGCLALHLHSGNEAAKDCDYSFHLNRYYGALWPDEPSNRFPPYYTFCEDKLVLIFPAPEAVLIDHQFNKRSKKKLSKLVLQRLEGPLVLYATNDKGVKMKLRSPGGVAQGGGIDICYKDGKIIAITTPRY